MDTAPWPLPSSRKFAERVQVLLADPDAADRRLLADLAARVIAADIGGRGVDPRPPTPRGGA